jgi:hypothetical protein
MKKTNIAICKATISERFHARYMALLDANQVRLETKKRSNEYCEESMVPLQNSAVENLLQKKHGAVVVSDSSVLPSSVPPFSSQLSVASTSSTLTSIRGRKPPPFAFLSQRSMKSTISMDI